MFLSAFGWVPRGNGSEVWDSWMRRTPLRGLRQREPHENQAHQKVFLQVWTSKKVQSLNPPKSIYVDSPWWNCSICEETFLSKFRLKTHQFKHGADDKVFTCDICAKQFQRMNYLKLHRRIHDPDYKAAAAEKTKFCDQCGINIKYESYR